MKSLIIAVDGPAASGKGTLAKRLAAHFGLPALDTGLLYRAVGQKMRDEGHDLDDAAAATAIARRFDAAWLTDERLREAIYNLFIFWQLDAESAAIAADSLADWIDNDKSPRANGAEADYYQQLGIYDAPRNQRAGGGSAARLGAAGTATPSARARAAAMCRVCFMAAVLGRIGRTEPVKVAPGPRAGKTILLANRGHTEPSRGSCAPSRPASRA